MMMHTDIVRLVAGAAGSPEYDFRVAENPGTKQEMDMREGNSLELGVDRSGLEWLVNHSFYRHGCEAVEGDVR
jgi:hypothetical protein